MANYSALTQHLEKMVGNKPAAKKSDSVRTKDFCTTSPHHHSNLKNRQAN